jgi:hypothetical protein
MRGNCMEARRRVVRAQNVNAFWRDTFNPILTTSLFRFCESLHNPAIDS